MTKKLSRKKDHRELMQRNLLTSLVLYEKIVTTKPKAKQLSSLFDRLISKAKDNDSNAKRNVNSILLDKKASAKVFDILIQRYSKRTSGLTSIANLSPRKGDNSEICQIILLDRKAKSDLAVDRNKNNIINDKGRSDESDKK